MILKYLRNHKSLFFKLRILFFKSITELLNVAYGSSSSEVRSKLLDKFEIFIFLLLVIFIFLLFFIVFVSCYTRTFQDKECIYIYYSEEDKPKSHLSK